MSSENLDSYMLALRQKMVLGRAGGGDPTTRAELDHTLEHYWQKLSKDEREEAEIRARLIRALRGGIL